MTKVICPKCGREIEVSAADLKVRGGFVMWGNKSEDLLCQCGARFSYGDDLETDVVFRAGGVKFSGPAYVSGDVVGGDKIVGDKIMGRRIDGDVVGGRVIRGDKFVKGR